jgi:ribosomal-protein-alanine N-acetyltransferase
VGAPIRPGLERRALVDAVALPEGVDVRALREEDIDAVVVIETEAFSTPWKRDTFANLIGRDGVELLVMTHTEHGVVGYAVLWCILDQGELANLALQPGKRGSGLGSHLLRQVLKVARMRGVAKLFLEVRASNERARDLYANFGFTEVGRRAGYYDAPREDALVLLATLDG